MKRYYYITGIMLISALLFSSCKSEEITTENDIPGTNNDSPENTDTPWNRENTFNLYFITTLDDSSANPYISDVIRFVNNENDKCSIALIERTDVTNYNDKMQRYYPTTDISHNTGRFCSFAPQGYKENNIEGATIVFNHKINKIQTTPISDDCFMQFSTYQANAIEGKNKIEVPLAYAHFNSEKQIENSGEAFSLYNQNIHQAVIVGTVKTSLIPVLQEKIKVSQTLRLTKVSEEDSEYAVFLIGRASYKLREVKEISSIDGLKTYVISIETNIK